MLWLTVILILPYILVLLKIYRSLLTIKSFNTTTNPSIFVSVVVACRNEQENLPRLLKSLSAQNYPDELFEVIIVNDNSTDKTFETASDFCDIKNIVVINNKGTGKKQAIRTGRMQRKAKKQNPDKNKGDTDGTDEDIFPGTFQRQLIAMVVYQPGGTQCGDLGKNPGNSNMVGEVSGTDGHDQQNQRSQIDRSGSRGFIMIFNVDVTVNSSWYGNNTQGNQE